MDLRERAGHKGTVAVVHIDFNQQRAAGGVDGVGGADQRALESLAGYSGKVRSIFMPALDGLRVELRHVGVDAQGLERLHVKELCLAPWLISWPVSTSRAVTTPSNGA